MKKLSTLILIILFTGSQLDVNAQAGQTDTLAQKQMKQLFFMQGNWSGSGWIYGPDRQKHSFEQTEKVDIKLDGTALLIEGHGKDQGKTIHHALAIITANPAENTFKFSSQMSDGKGGQFKGEMVGDAFHWYPNDYIRYIITLNNKNEWYEIGEINREGNWFQFFEMTLTKQ